MARRVFDFEAEVTAAEIFFEEDFFSSTDFLLDFEASNRRSSSSKYDGAIKVDSVRPLQIQGCCCCGWILLDLTEAIRPPGWEKSRAKDAGTEDFAPPAE